jgi:Rod binding domain-containing protein
MTLAAISPGLQAVHNRQEIASAGSQPETSAHKKLRKAAQEFEGILIAQLLGEFNMGFSTLGGGTPMAGSDTLNSLAIQTLSGAMARRGGFGIGAMLVHQLDPSLDREQQKQGGGKIKTVSGG